MPQDYFNDASGTAAPTEDMAAAPPAEGEDTSTRETSIVPKSFFAGKENLAVGDTETVRITAINDDSVEIECVSEYGGEKEAAPESPPMEARMPGMME